ncbi:MAG: tRNA (adenosine(37)-N6)-dimethylallyltransferase MiaA [Rhizobiales bacterium]|nr:tRNA (adenosine(37)-N6)-dimethylallyltransferase MiaA [Hyphomicrobiales bacterium]
MSTPAAILLAGPTASGKSALALALAERHGGVVIDADSMQVYRDLRIITARPVPEEEARVPHRLYGHVDAAENYSVGRWCIDAAAALAEAAELGRLPILTGGTGLYFKALAHGLSAIPPVPAEVRAAVRARLESGGVASLHAELAQRDPESAARLMAGDRARVTRALEVVLATGRTIGGWHRVGLQPVLDPVRCFCVFLDPDREAAKRRIDARFDAMLAAGALEEVRALDARGLDPALPAMKAHGVPWLRRHLHGEISLAEAAEGGKRDTRRYTRRQATWFRNQLPDWLWLTPDGALGRIEAELAGAATSASS